MSSIKLIFAVSSNNIIGRNNKLPWHIPEDLARFKELTNGDIVVMGKNTWYSLPGKTRPLPGRTNVVLSRDKDLKIQGAVVIDSIPKVLETYKDSGKTIWFIGGHKVLTKAIQHADEIQMTFVLRQVDGDVTGPYINMDKWKIVDKSSVMKSGLFEYQFVTMKRRE